ncbi:hypothetical protein K0U91_01080 [Chryseobacterium chendengshani]|uniref:hypothetical protein n=1 Tax=Chryseobacterium sp. LJ668 TaxID=2864040 RepID=UPI001C690C9C|nr:hypothetical protein [Chryseobacterium sp. LJ668]MBW8523817.1 hypothetical protein [Chryseobacterium sp. LJ668]QYK16760.1 hypothetical protein K0U91_01080 [Chryseobacterium sp. LJ668]
MKKLIPIVSLISACFVLHNCTNEDHEYSIQEEVHHKVSDDSPLSNTSRSDSTKSEDNELYPDPPVKDTHDWITKP